VTDSSAMRLQVRIEKRTTAPDPAGERVTSWVLVALRRAEKLQTPGRELWVAAQRPAACRPSSSCVTRGATSR
jgi:hypothetical protein